MTKTFDMPFSTAWERAKEYEEVLQKICEFVRKAPDPRNVLGPEAEAEWFGAYSMIYMKLIEKGWL